jgi:NAD(P)-dependent dehydrogenase (short-subunit alcohol dehydrogenase family)
MTRQNTLSKKHAFVSGGSGGIGKAIALKFADEGVGALTFSYGKNKLAADQLVLEVGRKGVQRVYAVQLDVPKTDVDVPRFNEALEQIVQVAGMEISIAVNTIGISPNRPFEEQTIEGKDGWLDVFRTNVFGSFLMIRAIGLRMASKGEKGSIVDINSSNAFNSYAEFSMHYDMAKASQARMIAILAEVFARRYGIRLNGVAPGWVDTPLNNSVPEEELRKELDKIWLGSMVKPSQVADVVAFLCSEEASAITGQNILVDNGYRA